ncbi:TPR-like protein [Suillus ampliporus]|nr:TPR-like protein [Suillus ampliporus]
MILLMRSPHEMAHVSSWANDIADEVEKSRVALQCCPPDHSRRSASLHDRFEQRSAIDLHRVALQLRPIGHSHRSASLDSLANCLRDKFHQRGSLSDLDDAVALHRAALVIRLTGHPDRSASLNNLAIGLHDRFNERGAIELHQAALELRPPGHSDRSILLTRFKERGTIELHRAALQLRPPGHPDRSILLTSFEQRGVQSNLDEAIELHRAALELRHTGHSRRSTLLTRFEHRGIQSDFDEAIECYRDALALSPPGHSLRSTSFFTRFEHRGVQSDLDEAIERYRDALTLSPPGHSSDLDEAIERYQDALVLCPPGHSLRSMCLNNLAQSLLTRFEQRGVQSDLDEAIERYQDALVLCPPGHSVQSMCLNNLALSLFTRFEQCGVQSDLDEAIELHRAALKLCPPGHSDQSTPLDNLAVSILARYRQRGALSDRDEAFRLYFQLSCLSHASSREDLCAAKSWVASAEEMNHGSSLDAYQTALKFLDQHVALLSSSLRHFDVVKEATSTLAMDAFSCSLRNGASTTAVELVEQGHAVFWTQLARFRTPLDELSLSGDTGAALAEEFKQLSSHIRKAFDESTEDQSSQIRRLTMQWDDVVSRIRMLPDFSRFLLPPIFSDLQKAAEHGPVIIVNASKYSCDALIILSAHDPVHVPLDITRAEVSELSFEFQSLTEKFGSSNHELQLVSILRKLWLRIVSPVVKVLRESKVLRGSRIWWCPTAEFTLLPLHSAGPYEQKSRNLSSFYISSYTPTLAALIRARQQISRDAGFNLACHGMPNRQKPFESSFAMRDGPLTIKDIIRSHLQNPEFAFLSACHTTVGDESSPDEAVHLAAAMQFSGFRSVIGSMWSVDDEVARQIVSAFYGYLVDESGRLDCTRAAGALHKAVKSLRKMNIPLEQQIVFRTHRCLV